MALGRRSATSTLHRGRAGSALKRPRRAVESRGRQVYLKVELAEDPSFATGARYLNKLIQGHRTQNGRRQASKQKAEVERGEEWRRSDQRYSR